MTQHLTDSPDLTVVRLAGRWAFTLAQREEGAAKYIALVAWYREVAD
jgi:hypothetical protein